MSRWPFRLFLWASVICILPGNCLLGQSTGSAPQNSSSQKPSSADPSSTSPSPTLNDENSGPSSDPAPAKPQADLSPPRSDRVNAGDLGAGVGESSSKDTQVDLSPPEDDAKAHPKSAEAMSDAVGATGGGSSVSEFHPWDAHKAAKDVEVGDFYFKRKNYKAAEDRYREALYFKDNDAVATIRLAVCLEKLDRPDDALAEYESYLRILPFGPQAEESKKAIERLKGSAATAKGK
jgi:tetratricopeptide (TPR) repeat protein